MQDAIGFVGGGAGWVLKFQFLLHVQDAIRFVGGGAGWVLKFSVVTARARCYRICWAGERGGY